MLNYMHNYWYEAFLLLVAMALVVLCGKQNDCVWMYLCGYGSSFPFFIIGGVAGPLMLYVLSLWLSRLPYRQMVQTLSKGSIFIIGVHIIIVRRLTELPDRLWVEDLLFSVFILLMFIPLIRLAELYFPLLLGRRS